MIEEKQMFAIQVLFGIVWYEIYIKILRGGTEQIMGEYVNMSISYLQGWKI